MIDRLPEETRAELRKLRTEAQAIIDRINGILDGARRGYQLHIAHREVPTGPAADFMDDPTDDDPGRLPDVRPDDREPWPGYDAERDDTRYIGRAGEDDSEL